MAATKYILMNQDTRCWISSAVNEFDEPEFYEGAWYVDYRQSAIAAFAAFLEHRKAPKHREHIWQLLEQYGCDDLRDSCRPTPCP